MVDAVSDKSSSATSELKEEKKDGPTQPCEKERGSRRARPLLISDRKPDFVRGQSSTRSPDRRDLSRWHESCRPFLLNTIQHRTESDIQSLIQSVSLEKHILQQMLRRLGVSFLELGPSMQDDIHLSGKGTRKHNGKRTGSTSSQTSLNSMASQISDSSRNDVQQSAETLYQSLQLGLTELKSIEGGAGKLSSIRRYLVRQSPFTDYAKVKELKSAMQEAAETIHQFESDMHTIGFPDVGLKLNIYEQNFNMTVLRYLQTVKKERNIERLRKMLDRPEKWKHWHEDYPNFTSMITKMAGEIKQSLQGAIETRDCYLKAAYNHIDRATQTYARLRDLQIKDEYDGMVLVQRVFVLRIDPAL